MDDHIDYIQGKLRSRLAEINSCETCEIVYGVAIDFFDQTLSFDLYVNWDEEETQELLTLRSQPLVPFLDPKMFTDPTLHFMEQCGWEVIDYERGEDYRHTIGNCPIVALFQGYDAVYRLLKKPAEPED